MTETEHLHLKKPGQGDYYNPDFITQTNDTIQRHGYITNLITDDAIDWMGIAVISVPVARARHNNRFMLLMKFNLLQGFPLAALSLFLLFLVLL